ncbi:hypothetical protein KR093_009423 [Drosophila rubida]|uniref:Uncharacterized protein n=1 Tax=Drosophila rubida TaxID=30044 RepID=A0AAD4KBV7_9MUSC|nr:hypothetical protein KR093_009423 [Drosophila rubida]
MISVNFTYFVPMALTIFFHGHHITLKPTDEATLASAGFVVLAALFIYKLKTNAGIRLNFIIWKLLEGIAVIVLLQFMLIYVWHYIAEGMQRVIDTLLDIDSHDRRPRHWLLETFRLDLCNVCLLVFEYLLMLIFFKIEELRAVVHISLLSLTSFINSDYD